MAWEGFLKFLDKTEKVLEDALENPEEFLNKVENFSENAMNKTGEFLNKAENFLENVESLSKYTEEDRFFEIDKKPYIDISEIRGYRETFSESFTLTVKNKSQREIKHLKVEVCKINPFSGDSEDSQLNVVYSREICWDGIIEAGGSERIVLRVFSEEDDFKWYYMYTFRILEVSYVTFLDTLMKRLE